jgi:5-methylcytosine-specific restriction endonuclease McrA
MSFDQRLLTRVYQRTSGYCHLCHCKLALKNHGRLGRRGAWEVEHSVPRSKGGTDHLNNLFPACVACNRDKGTRTSRTARGWNEKTCAPLNPGKRKQAKLENGLAGALAGGFAGGAVAGPVGAIIGAVTGACIGSSGNPDRK